MTTNTTRRAVLGATAALAVAPAAALAAPSVSATPVAALWAEVMNLTIRMAAHAPAIAAAERGDSVPGWMRLQGEANALGDARYDRLISILKSKVETTDDLVIVAQAASHRDIVSGPGAFAAGRLAEAAFSLRVAA